jgi:hypothetical protein
MARNVTAIEAGPSISLLAAMARFDGYEHGIKELLEMGAAMRRSSEPTVMEK